MTDYTDEQLRAAEEFIRDWISFNHPEKNLATLIAQREAKARRDAFLEAHGICPGLAPTGVDEHGFECGVSDDELRAVLGDEPHEAMLRGIDQAEAYRRLIMSNNCTPEQQAGPEAGWCGTCESRTVHQHTRSCIACGTLEDHQQVLEQEKQIRALEAQVEELEKLNGDLQHKMNTKYWDACREENTKLRAQAARDREEIERLKREVDDEDGWYDTLIDILPEVVVDGEGNTGTLSERAGFLVRENERQAKLLREAREIVECNTIDEDWQRRCDRWLKAAEGVVGGE